MRPLAGFGYVRVRSLEEAWAAGDQNPDDAAFLAGGTDLLVKLKKGQIRTSLLINLKGIPGLCGVQELGNRIEIGALTPISELLRSRSLEGKAALLPLAANQLGSRQIRNLATIGGNLCSGSPAADLSIALLCLQADVKIHGPEGSRVDKLEAFFKGPGLTSLKPREILGTISVPIFNGGWAWDYQKLTHRRGMEIGIVNVAVGLRLEQDVSKEARIALGAVAPTPIRATRAERHITGKKLSPGLIEEVAQMAAQESRSIDDIRGSAAYRQEMVMNLIRRAFTRAWASFG